VSMRDGLVGSTITDVLKSEGSLEFAKTLHRSDTELRCYTGLGWPRYLRLS
jgi:hypothetical protein